MQNIEFLCADKDLTPNEKLEAIQNELLEDSYYSEDGNIYWEGNLCNLDIEDWWEEQYNTNLPSEYLEEGIDAGLREFVRLVHANAQCDVTQQQIDNFDRLDDVMTINNSNRDRRKFSVMKVSQDWNWIRKVIWNEEGNFEERENPDDKPDWLMESEAKEEAKAKAYKETKARKMLWKQIRDDRKAYKKYYDGYDLLKWVDSNRASKLKKLGDKYYRDYKKYSKLQDELTAIDEKDILKEKTKQAENILHLFVTFQQEAPSSIVDKLLREDVKAYYKKYWYNSTISYLNKAIRKAKQLA